MDPADAVEAAPHAADAPSAAPDSPGPDAQTDAAERETVQEVVESRVISRRAERLREIETRRRERRRKMADGSKRAERLREIETRREARRAEIEVERAQRQAEFEDFDDDPAEDAQTVDDPGQGGVDAAAPAGGLSVIPAPQTQADALPAQIDGDTALASPPPGGPPAGPAVKVTPIAAPRQGRAHIAGRRSRWPLVLSFLLMVGLPGGAALHYLYTVAVDRFHSTAAFSVRSEEAASMPDLALPIPVPGIGGTPDADILNEFIRSQQLVERLDAELGLRAMYNRAPEDWVFALGEDRSIEELVDHWRYMVDVKYDITTSIIELTVHAFTPEDAQTIAQAVLRESTALVNSLSQQAREDRIGFAKTDLDEAEARLKEIRLALRRFRNENQTADPTQDVEVQMGVINALQQQLAEALIDRSTILDVSRPNDPRVAELERRIRAIEAQIELEKDKLGSQTDERALADRIGAFEELSTDLDFAEESYTIAKAAFDEARIEARRQTRYIAAHIEPTLSQAPQYPERALIATLLLGALITIWGLSMLVWYNVHDRR
ncbi:MAG: hypothetical protein AAFR46_06670 [Pseudomonadota bacterium]